MFCFVTRLRLRRLSKVRLNLKQALIPMRCLDKNNLVSGYKQERKKLTPIDRKIKKKLLKQMLYTLTSN